jgi:4-amino-4-deoxy-L-arabinose transferase-like glycosyltransferase
MSAPAEPEPAAPGLVPAVAVGLAVVVLILAVGRLLAFGWAAVAADDARYVFVGLSTLDGHGPVTPTGNLFLLRSPVYGILLAAGSRIAGGDPVDGARVAAAILTVLGLLAAIRIGWLLGGPVAAVATTVAIVGFPLLWSLLPTLRIDLPQAAGVSAVLLALHRPSTRRWALAGALLGLTVLVKETVILLAAAPLAFAGSIARDRLVYLGAVFLGTAAVVAGWWWIVVWFGAGTIFPLNAVGVIERRDVGADIRLDPFGLALLGAIAVAWLVVAGGARRDTRLRLLVVAAVCLAPPALYATVNGLSTRNYAGLAILSAIAIGVATARIAAPVRTSSPARRPVARGVLLALIAAAGLAGAAVGQVRVDPPDQARLPAEIAGWLREEAQQGGRVVMTFRFSEVVALETYGRLDVPTLAAVRVDAAAPLSGFIWLGLRDRQLFGYTRGDWTADLDPPLTSHLVLAGPHPLTPLELIGSLDRGELPGLSMAQTFDADGDWATAYRVEPGSVRAGPADVPLHLSPEAAVAWIDLAATASAASNDEDAVRRLAESGAIVVGASTTALFARLAGLACLVPSVGGATDEARIVPAGAPCDPS